jgi:hypothetical protein
VSFSTYPLTLSIIFSFLIATICLGSSNYIFATSNNVQAGLDKSQASFNMTDEPGRWFKNNAGPIDGTHSLAIVNPDARIDFTVTSNTVHTITSLAFPTASVGMPFDMTEPTKGSKSITLSDPGLYIFTCKVHTYMFGIVIVDDPSTEGLDLGQKNYTH